jgi:hypothetical protein
MLKLFSMLVVAGITTLAGVDPVRACGCGQGAAAPAAATAAANSPRAPSATAQSGRQSTRRYSMAPTTDYRAPVMMRRGRSSNGPSWSATRKVLGY